VTSSAPIHRSVADTVARFDGYIAAATPIIVVIRSITGRRSQSEVGDEPAINVISASATATTIRKFSISNIAFYPRMIQARAQRDSNALNSVL